MSTDADDARRMAKAHEEFRDINGGHTGKTTSLRARVAQAIAAEMGDGCYEDYGECADAAIRVTLNAAVTAARVEARRIQATETSTDPTTQNSQTRSTVIGCYLAAEVVAALGAEKP